MGSEERLKYCHFHFQDIPLRESRLNSIDPCQIGASVQVRFSVFQLISNILFGWIGLGAYLHGRLPVCAIHECRVLAVTVE